MLGLEDREIRKMSIHELVERGSIAEKTTEYFLLRLIKHVMEV